MALTTRGRSMVGVFAVLAVAAVVGAVVILGGKGGNPQAQVGDGRTAGVATTSPSPILRICPLTGEPAVGGIVPNRPALAVKVENLPEARPQTGLLYSDIIYEEPVEANITRFIVIYQCEDAAKIEPIRSGRLTDPPVLVEFGKPVFGYAGAVPQVIRAVARAGITDVNAEQVPDAYQRDPARVAPHNLYSSSKELYAAAKSLGRGGIPQPVFTYTPDVPATATSASSVHIPFSQYADVFWTWSASKSTWLRSYGTVPATYSDGSQMSTTNVVIQMVRIRMTDITDANGVHSPEVVSVGSGVAYVLRDGKMIKATWSRPKLSGVTVFRDSAGNVIPLAPGKTWVELVPNDLPVTVAG